MLANGRRMECVQSNSRRKVARDCTLGKAMLFRSLFWGRVQRYGMHLHPEPLRR